MFRSNLSRSGPLRLANALGVVVLMAMIFGVSTASPALARGNSSGTGKQEKPRIVLMNDPELDDQNTVLRYLLYSNEFDTEGLVYASSGVHWAGDGKGTKWFVPGREYTRFGLNLCPCESWRWKPGERFIDDAVDIYAKVYPNLKKHANGYPAPKDLRSKILNGNIEFDGDIAKDSDGSNLIRRLLLDHSSRPVYLLTGAGQSTIARALKSIKDEYFGTPDWPNVYRKVSSKAVIQSFGDQDGMYAQYIQPNWPDVKFRQMSTNIWGYGARSAVLPDDAKYLSAEWTKANVSDVGPLGNFYRVWGDGKQMVPGDIFDYFGHSGLTTEQLKAMGYIVWTAPQAKGSWISEGDTSIYMNLIQNGLRADVDPSWGGWGGRAGTDIGTNGTPSTDYASARWFGAAQEDFAARLKWTVTDKYKAANHEPTVNVQGKLDRTTKPGEKISLTAKISDPDKNKLTAKWWRYADADTYDGATPVRMAEARNGNFSSAKVTVPADAQVGQNMHFILSVTDDGGLTSYQRVVVTVV
ncbi:DUF1593 domain-containing protein [Streptomyces shenzhenensis]|nr:DUF1593 domain-containing protein [Streptomyces shenzhenensis]